MIDQSQFSSFSNKCKVHRRNSVMTYITSRFCYSVSLYGGVAVFNNGAFIFNSTQNHI